MICPVHEDGIHRMQANNTCACGYRLVFPPICVSIEVTNKSEVLIDEGFNCDTVETAAAALRRAADKLDGG